MFCVFPAAFDGYFQTMPETFATPNPDDQIAATLTRCYP